MINALFSNFLYCNFMSFKNCKLNFQLIFISKTVTQKAALPKTFSFYNFQLFFILKIVSQKSTLSLNFSFLIFQLFFISKILAQKSTLPVSFSFLNFLGSRVYKNCIAETNDSQNLLLS